MEIDRRALVARHAITYDRPHPNELLQVGNGEIAFGVDITGLQTTAGQTLSQWGWHSHPRPAHLEGIDLRLTSYEVGGRTVSYATNSQDQEELYGFLRQNPHRLNLGRIALKMLSGDNTLATLDDLTSVRQHLDLWAATITSSYTLDGRSVTVETLSHPTLDAIAVRIQSPLLALGKLSIEFAFPYGQVYAADHYWFSKSRTGGGDVDGADWDHPEAHHTTLTRPSSSSAQFARQLDADTYITRLSWNEGPTLVESAPHTYLLQASSNCDTIEFVCHFSRLPTDISLPSFAETKSANEKHWENFWLTGGAIDLSASRDPRWRELERRIVLSQYLLAIQEAGSLPPQESGLYNNSGWFGKFHLEMHWWHGAHYALWNRWPLFARSLDWYRDTLPAARALAASQGYKGARWPKMVGPEGRDSPSGVGTLLLWQIPHPIFYANLDYRLHPSPETLEKWRDIVFDTAAFLSSYPVRDKVTGHLRLGPPLKTVSENTKETVSFNPIFELSYFRYALEIAQTWRALCCLPRDADWDYVIEHLAPLPQLDGFYLLQGDRTDTYTEMNWEHPALIGPSGMFPGAAVDPATMHATVLRVWKEWRWEHCWGWDFPMMAMAAARNNEPQIAVDILLFDTPKNAFLANGCSTGGPYPYFPSNGGLLYAAAMMAAGWDGCPHGNAPGFPNDGNWIVRWENMNPAP